MCLAELGPPAVDIRGELRQLHQLIITADAQLGRALPFLFRAPGKSGTASRSTPSSCPVQSGKDSRATRLSGPPFAPGSAPESFGVHGSPSPEIPAAPPRTSAAGPGPPGNA